MQTRALTLSPDPDPAMDPAPEPAKVMPRKNKKPSTRLVTPAATNTAAKASTAAAASAASKDPAAAAAMATATTTGTTMAATTTVEATVRGEAISTVRHRHTTTVRGETPEGGDSKAAALTAVADAAATNHRQCPPGRDYPDGDGNKNPITRILTVFLLKKSCQENYSYCT